MKFLILLLVFTFNSYAAKKRSGERLRPKSIIKDSKKLVFVDFQRAIHNIDYDFKTKKAVVKSRIEFVMPEAGYAIYDQVVDPTSIYLNETKTKAILTQIPTTKVRVLRRKIPAGNHKLEITTDLKTLVKFDDEANNQNVYSSFWLSDLDSRNFLERYIPSSFEYDQVKLKFLVKVRGTPKEHTLITNGKTKNISKNTWEVTYPSFYTCSSVFYHLFPSRSKKTLKTQYKSSDNRMIDVLLYTNQSWLDLKQVYATTKKYMEELEENYGPWPHPRNIIYIAGRGGMEYSGATMTSMSALRHELNHYYFARNVMPARGNSGWIDEAIASWGDNNYNKVRSPNMALTGSHSVYRRTTDTRAYTKGASLLAYLHYKFTSKGGFKKFLKYYFERRERTVVSNEDFRKDIEQYFNTDMGPFFNKYIYGKTSAEGRRNALGKVKSPNEKNTPMNPIHRPFNEKVLRKSL